MFEEDDLSVDGSVFEDSDPSDTDPWPSTPPEGKPSDITSDVSSPTSDAETSPDLLFKENFFIDDQYLIFANKLGKSIRNRNFVHEV